VPLFGEFAAEEHLHRVDEVVRVMDGNENDVGLA
jgi:hypothetical protein